MKQTLAVTAFAFAAIASGAAMAQDRKAAGAMKGPDNGEVLRRCQGRTERLRGRSGHHLCRHVEGRLPGQRLEDGREGHVHDDQDPEGHRLAHAGQELAPTAAARTRSLSPGTVRIASPCPGRGTQPTPIHAMQALTAGLGLKPQHFDDAHACRAAGLWFEVHPENYMVAGGPRLAWLDAIRERHPLSLHGVAMSLAADSAPDAAHLERLAALVDRLAPGAGVRASGMEHVGRRLSTPTCCRCRAHDRRCGASSATSRRVQDRLRRPIALENPSHYLAFDEHEFDELGLPGRDRAPQRLHAAARCQQRLRQCEQPRLPARGRDRCGACRPDLGDPPGRAQRATRRSARGC